MDYVHIMKMFHSCDHLPSIFRRDRFLKASEASKECVKLASWSILQNNVYFSLVEEKAVHLKYVFMLKVTVDLNLPS